MSVRDVYMRPDEFSRLEIDLERLNIGDHMEVDHFFDNNSPIGKRTREEAFPLSDSNIDSLNSRLNRLAEESGLKKHKSK
jgi:hypothetical protein